VTSFAFPSGGAPTGASADNTFFKAATTAALAAALPTVTITSATIITPSPPPTLRLCRAAAAADSSACVTDASVAASVPCPRHRRIGGRVCAVSGGAESGGIVVERTAVKRTAVSPSRSSTMQMGHLNELMLSLAWKLTLQASGGSDTPSSSTQTQRSCKKHLRV